MADVAVASALGIVLGVIAYRVYKGKPSKPIQNVTSRRRQLNDYWRNKQDDSNTVQTANISEYSNLMMNHPRLTAHGLTVLPDSNKNGVIQHNLDVGKPDKKHKYPKEYLKTHQ